MDLLDNGKSERRSAFMLSLVIAIALSVLAAPVVEAAVTRIRGTVNVKDSTGDAIDSQATGALGLFAAPGSSGAIAVRNFAGGGGFLGAADCAAGGLPDTITLPTSTGVGKVVTGIIVTGADAKASISSEQVDALLGVPEGTDFPVANVTTTPENQTQFIGLGNGLSLTAPLKVKCTGTSGNIVVLGQ